MAGKHRFDSRKLVDPELAEFAEQGSTGRLSVIVELASEPPQVVLADRGSIEDSGRPYAAPPIDEDALRQQMDTLETELKRLTAEPLVRLDVAQAFVVELSPEQLRAVSLLSETGCVRLNRTHHV